MTVTVVSCVYGDHARFVSGWLDAVEALDPPPDQVIIAADRALGLPPRVGTIIGPTVWRHPQAQYLSMAIGACDTEWAWILDIDDRCMPDALDGLEDVDADVWMTGFVRWDEDDDLYDEYVPPAMTPRDVLAMQTSMVPGGSAVRVELFREVGGFPDVAFQDWALWRKLARAGSKFESSGRTHYCYNRHAATRSVNELTALARPAHMAEMLNSEAIRV